MDKITQRDVANFAGTSTGTVSRVLNNIPLVDANTRAKVLEAIKTLGYIPNHAAQTLAIGRTKNILLLILDKEPITTSTWQYELPILQGINNYIQSKGYVLQIEMLHYLEGSAGNNIHERLFQNRSVDGLIVLTSWHIESASIEKIFMWKIPTVFIGNGPYQHKGDPVGSAVLFDNYTIIKEVYSMLWQLGHRAIAFIKGDEMQLHSAIRLDAFLQANKEHNSLYREEYIFSGNYSVQGGYRALYAFAKLASRPTAVICANDLMAIGLMKAASELGISIPDDLSVIGFDNVEISEYLTPPLSTIQVPAYDMGLKSAIMLINKIEGTEPEETLVLPASFVIRQSTTQIQVAG